MYPRLIIDLECDVSCDECTGTTNRDCRFCAPGFLSLDDGK